MTKSLDIRNIVLSMLTDTLEKKEFSHKVLNRILSGQDFSAQDRRFLSGLYFGTIENLLYLDHVIDQHSKTKTGKMKPVVKNLLRMSVCQIFFMDSVPDRAAVSEAVRLCGKRKLDGLKGFVNGVLRTIVRNKEKLTKERETLPPYIRFSVPEWIVSRIKDQYGNQAAQCYLKASGRKDAATTVRILGAGSLKKTQAAVELLKADGCSVDPVEGLPGAVKISGFASLTDLCAFKNGQIIMQDVSSMLVPLVAKSCAAKADAFLIDVCAAPGGKSIGCADFLPESTVLAMDLSQQKADLIKENTARLGLKNVIVKVHDAANPLSEYKEKADVVICDVPCSGLGVIGRKPDLKYRLKQEDISQLAVLQRTILLACASYVKPGGCLLYSTCTVTKEENQLNAEWFCKESGFRMAPLSGIPEQILTDQQIKTCQEGSLQLINGLNDSDGFFIARFVKEEGC